MCCSCICPVSPPQLMLGVPEQALSVLHEALEPILAHGGIMDKGRALMLAARCQMALVATRPNGREQAGEDRPLPLHPAQHPLSFHNSFIEGSNV